MITQPLSNTEGGLVLFFYDKPGHCRRWENMIVLFLQNNTDMDGNVGKPWHSLLQDHHYDWWMQQTDKFVKTFLPTVKTTLLKIMIPSLCMTHFDSVSD